MAPIITSVFISDSYTITPYSRLLCLVFRLDIFKKQSVCEENYFACCTKPGICGLCILYVY